MLRKCLIQSARKNNDVCENHKPFNLISRVDFSERNNVSDEMQAEFNQIAGFTDFQDFSLVRTLSELSKVRFNDNS